MSEKKSNYAVIDLEIHLEIVLCCGSEVEEKREIPSQLRLHQPQTMETRAKYWSKNNHKVFDLNS